MILINHILEITPDCVEGIFCFDKLKCLAKRTCSGACYKFFICKILLAKIWKKEDASLIRNLKKAALNSLDGKWGVSIGISALYYFVPTLSASAIASFIYLIFGLFIGIIGLDVFFIYSMGGQLQVDLTALVLLILSYFYRTDLFLNLQCHTRYL